MSSTDRLVSVVDVAFTGAVDASLVAESVIGAGASAS